MTSSFVDCCWCMCFNNFLNIISEVKTLTESSVRSSPTIEERMRGLGVDVAPSGSRVGDSGYMSQDPLLRTDATLLPHLNRGKVNVHVICFVY